MSKLYKDMTEEEKKNHYERTEKYRKNNMDKYASAALKYYHSHKSKCAEKARNWRLNNKENIKIKQRESKRKRKDEAIQYLGGICLDCGQQYHPAIFEFHHRNPQEKSGKDPSKMLSLSWVKILNELDKCDLLCANCHRLRHHKESYGNQ